MLREASITGQKGIGRLAKNTVQALPERLPGLTSELGETRAKEVQQDPGSLTPDTGIASPFAPWMVPQFPTRSDPRFLGTYSPPPVSLPLSSTVCLLSTAVLFSVPPP